MIQALSLKHVVKVPSSAGLVPLVDTCWQLDDALDDAFAGVGANTIPDLEESVFPLPTALVPVLTMDKLVKAIGEHRMTGAPISKCIRMQKMDLHMTGSTSVSPTHNFRSVRKRTCSECLRTDCTKRGLSTTF